MSDSPGYMPGRSPVYPYNTAAQQVHRENLLFSQYMTGFTENHPNITIGGVFSNTGDFSQGLGSDNEIYSDTQDLLRPEAEDDGETSALRYRQGWMTPWFLVSTRFSC